MKIQMQQETMQIIKVISTATTAIAVGNFGFGSGEGWSSCTANIEASQWVVFFMRTPMDWMFPSDVLLEPQRPRGPLSCVNSKF